MSDGRWLIEWMRIDSEEWRCCGPLAADKGFVVIGSKKFRTPAVVSCDRTEKPTKPYIGGHMMGPCGEILDGYDDFFWERWYLPPGVHPRDVEGIVNAENEWSEKHHSVNENEILSGDS